MPLHLLCLLLLLATTSRAAGGSHNVHVVVLSTDSGAFSARGLEYHHTGGLWANHINTTGGLGPARQPLRLTFVDAGSTVTTVQNTTRRALAGEWGPVHFFIAPYSSTLAPVAAMEVEMWSPPAGVSKPFMISGGAASESVYTCDSSLLPPCPRVGARRFQHLFGVLSPATTYFQPFVSLMKIRQAVSIALIAENATFPLAACAGAYSSARDQKLVVSLRTVIPRITDAASEHTRTVVGSVVRQLQAIKPDVVVGCTYTPGCEALLSTMEEMGYAPNAAALSVCVGSSSVADRLGSKLSFVHGPTQWDRRLKGRDYQESSTSAVRMFPKNSSGAGISPPEVFARAYEAVAGHPPSYQAAGAMAAFYSIQAGISIANSTDPEVVRSRLHLLFEPTFFGRLASSPFGTNVAKPMVTWQYDALTQLQIVTPLSAAEVEDVYPMPAWDERTYVHEMYAQWSEIVVVAVESVLIALSIGLMVLLFVNRHRPFIKQSSVLFCEISLTGAVVLYVAIAMWPIENSQATCGVRPWFMGLGMTTLLAPLMAKTYRIHKIFHNRLMKRVKLRDVQLLVATAAMLLPMALLLAIWTAVDPLVPRIYVPDKHRPGLNITVCSSNSSVFPALALAYCFVLVVVAAVLAYRTRDVWDVFNDAKSTHLAVYNILCIGTVLVIVVAFDSETSSGQRGHILRSFLLTVLVAGSEAALFLPTVIHAMSATKNASMDRVFPVATSSAQTRSHHPSATTSSDSSPPTHLRPPSSTQGWHKSATTEPQAPASSWWRSWCGYPKATVLPITECSMGQHIISQLHLRPFASSYVRSIFRSRQKVVTDNGSLPCASALFRMLPVHMVIPFYQTSSEELWMFSQGDCLVLHVIEPNGTRHDKMLGLAPGHDRYAVIPPGHWVAAESLVLAQRDGGLLPQTRANLHKMSPPGRAAQQQGYSLVSCFLAPGFSHTEDAHGDHTVLLQGFPQHRRLLQHIQGLAGPAGDASPSPTPRSSN